MMKNTNLEEVKNIYKAMLFLPIEETRFSPMVVQHPIFESGFYSSFCTKDNGKVIDSQIINILEDSTGLNNIRKQLCDRIDKCANVIEVYLMIRKSYRLTFLKFVKPYLSKTDFSELLADAWVSSDNSSKDANVSNNLAVLWFKQADKKVIMDEEEYKIYKNFTNKVTVYRGVSVIGNPSGLSWTNDYETAKWFAHRFDNDNEKGYIQKAEVRKEDILCYFSHEKELIIDSRKLNIEILTE